jgi:hypothetical protein
MHSINNNNQSIEYFYLRATKGIGFAILEHPDTLEWFMYVKNLPEPLKTVYAVTVLENQITNGGFDQYFSNLYGQFAFITIFALQKIKANQKSKLLTEALCIYNPLNLSEHEFAKWLTKREWLKELNLKNLLKQTESIDKSYWNSNEDVLLLLNNFINN